jgi:hypothetical protein
MDDVHVINSTNIPNSPVFLSDKLNALKEYYDSLIAQYDFDYSSIYPFEDVPKILFNEVIDFGYGNITTLLPVMRKELNIQLLDRDNEYYNRLQRERKNRFDCAKWKAHEYESNLRRIGDNDLNNKDDIRYRISEKQKQNLKEMHLTHPVLNTVDATNMIEEKCYELGISTVTVTGSIKTIYGNQENIMWNIILIDNEVKNVDITSGLMNKNIKDNYFYKSTEELKKDNNRQVDNNFYNHEQELKNIKVKKLELI